MSEYPEDEYSDVKSYSLVDVVGFQNSGMDAPDYMRFSDEFVVTYTS